MKERAKCTDASGHTMAKEQMTVVLGGALLTGSAVAGSLFID